MSKIPPQYLGNLTLQNARKQSELIKKSRDEYEKTGKVEDRPRVSSQKTPRSSHAIKFEKKYGFSVSDTSRVRREFPDTDVSGILAKGRAAYGSSGSRPNVTAEQWANARLASVLTGGAALKIDKDLVGARSMARIK